MNNNVASVFESMSYPKMLNNESRYTDWLKSVQNKYPLSWDQNRVNHVRGMLKDNPWKLSSQRASLLFKLAKAVESQKDFFAVVESSSTKKPLNQTKERDIPELISHLYNAANAVAFSRNSWTPYGIVGVFLEETNSPTLCQSLFLGPALSAGNAVFLCAHKDNYHSALLLLETARQIGFASEILNLVVDDVPIDQLNSFDFIVGCGSKPQKKTISSHIYSNTRPKAIITESADLASAAHGVICLASLNASMSPYSGACVLVQESIYETFWTELSTAVKKLLPLPSVLASTGDYYFQLDGQAEIEERTANISEAERQGAQLVFPNLCNPHEGKHGPILVRGVRPTSPLVQRTQTSADSQIIWVQSFRHSKEGVTLANSFPLAQHISIWGEHTSILLEMAKELNADDIWINTQNIIDTAEHLYTNMFSLQSNPYKAKCPEEGVQKRREAQLKNFVPKEISLNDLQSAVSLAKSAAKKWKDLDSSCRSQFLFSLAEKIRIQEEAKEPADFHSHQYLYEYASEATVPGLKSTISNSSNTKCWNWTIPHGVVAANVPTCYMDASALLAAMGAALLAGNTFIAITESTSVVDNIKQIISSIGLPSGVVNILPSNNCTDDLLEKFLKTDIDCVWILNELFWMQSKLLESPKEDYKRIPVICNLDLSKYDWKADPNHERLREWFLRQAIKIKKIWFEFEGV